MIEERIWFAIAVMNNDIFVAGGRDCNSVEKYYFFFYSYYYYIKSD